MTPNGAGQIDPQRGIVTWLTVYTVLLYAIPSRLVVGPLGSAGAPSMLMGLASAVIWLLLVIWGPRLGGRAEPVKTAQAVFLVCVGLSYVAAMTRPIDVDEVSPADVALLSAVSWSGTLLIAHDGLRTRADLEIVIRRFVTVGAGLALLGVVQFITNDSLIDRLSIPGLTSRGDAGVFIRDGLTRVAGTATHPIEFGALLSILLPLALHGSFHPGGRGPVRRWLPTVVIGGALAVSLSRTVYVGIGVAFAVLLLGWTSRQRRIAVVGATVAILAAITAYPRLVQSVTALFTSPAEDPSITSRTDSYAFALEFFTHAPVFGRGLGTFLPKYRIFDNQYLGILVSLGLLGVLAFIAMLVVAAAALLRMRRASTDPAMRDLALSMVASLAVGAVAFGVFDAFSFPMTAGTLFLCLGLSGAIARIGSLVDTTPMAGDVSDARVTLR